MVSIRNETQIIKTMTMKTTLLILLSAFFFNGNAQEKPDAILGTYLNPFGTAKIKIYQASNGYEGKIVWLSEPLDKNGNPKTDKNNGNKELRNRPILDLVTIKSLQYKNDEWSKGEMYNPERGGSVAFKVISISKEALIIKISKGFFSKEISLKRV